MPLSTNPLVNTGIHIINQDGILPEQLPKNIIVSGIARSGTSLVAGALSKLGVFMGNKAYPPVFEDVELSDTLEKKDLVAAQAMIERYNEKHPIWGWKRPSSVGYLDTVNSIFPNPVYIFIFKDIFSIAKRNQISMKFDLVSNMRSTHQQYGKLLTFIEMYHPQAMMVSYDKALMNRKLFVQSLCDFIKIVPLKDQFHSAVEFIRPNPADYLDASRVTKAKGRVGRMEELFVAGWATAVHNKNPIKVELFVNEKKVAVTKADLFRKDLMEKGIHPKGRVGFRFDLTEDQKLKKDDVVRVRAENEVKDLQNCPKVFEGVGTIEKDKEN